jgi:hypothetical protein
VLSKFARQFLKRRGAPQSNSLRHHGSDGSNCRAEGDLRAIHISAISSSGAVGSRSAMSCRSAERVRLFLVSHLMSRRQTKVRLDRGAKFQFKCARKKPIALRLGGATTVKRLSFPSTADQPQTGKSRDEENDRARLGNRDFERRGIDRQTRG